jgi:hypothetical protein
MTIIKNSKKSKTKEYNIIKDNGNPKSFKRKIAITNRKSNRVCYAIQKEKRMIERKIKNSFNKKKKLIKEIITSKLFNGEKSRSPNNRKAKDAT